MYVGRLILSCAAAVLFAGSSLAAPPDRDRHGPQNMQNMMGMSHGDQRGDRGDRGRHGDRDWRDDRGNWHNDHDRYWRRDFGNRGFIQRDRIFFGLKKHGYMRYTGEPYWFQGRYVIRTFDRWGRPIFVEINPYTGEVMGVVRF